MNANYMILPELGLILECCKGEASVAEAIKMKKKEVSDPLYNPGHSIIVDFQDFEVSVKAETAESASVFFDFLKSLNVTSKVAFITSEPHQVVVSTILRQLSREFYSFKIEVFSTIEAAIRYLGISTEHSDLINRKLFELNESTC